MAFFCKIQLPYILSRIERNFTTGQGKTSVKEDVMQRQYPKSQREESDMEDALYLIDTNNTARLYTLWTRMHILLYAIMLLHSCTNIGRSPALNNLTQ